MSCIGPRAQVLHWAPHLLGPALFPGCTACKQTYSTKSLRLFFLPKHFVMYSIVHQTNTGRRAVSLYNESNAQKKFTFKCWTCHACAPTFRFLRTLLCILRRWSCTFDICLANIFLKSLTNIFCLLPSFFTSTASIPHGPLSGHFLHLKHFEASASLCVVNDRDDHHPVCRLDIWQDSEFATGYGYPKTAFKRKLDTDTDPDIRTLLTIFWGFRLLEKVTHCTIVHLLFSEASFQPSVPLLRARPQSAKNFGEAKSVLATIMTSLMCSQP